MEKTGERGTGSTIGNDQNPSSEALPRSKRGGSKGDVTRRVTARGVMEKSWYVRVIEGKKVTGDDSMEYFLPMGVGLTF